MAEEDNYDDGILDNDLLMEEDMAGDEEEAIDLCNFGSQAYSPLSGSNKYNCARNTLKAIDPQLDSIGTTYMQYTT